jgi:N-formylglutamate amidohydrolase
MFQTDAPAKNPLFTYHAPLAERAIGIVSIPHSGEEVPIEFLSYLCADLATMREDVDFRVDALVDIKALQEAGVGVLVAHVHRVCVDLNRAEENCVMFWKENTQGVRLIGRDPTPHETETFIQRYHRPFFEVYASLIRDLERSLSRPVPVIDLHSMPSSPTAYHMKQNPHQKTHRADFCVSDQRGKTCETSFIQWFAEALKSKNYEVAINDPYIGGYVTTFVDRFKTNNIQIEIKRACYMNEKTKELVPTLAHPLKQSLTDVLIAGIKKFA